VQFQNFLHASISCKKGRKHQAPYTWEIFPRKNTNGGGNKQNEYGRADNVSPPNWHHFLTVLCWDETFFLTLSLPLISLFSSFIFSSYQNNNQHRTHTQAKPETTLLKGREDKATNLHSHKSNGSEQSSDYGRKKKEERREEESREEKRQCIGDHPSHTWNCEGKGTFGRTHIICPFLFILLICSLVAQNVGINSQV
jgi:hypothetical protein